jgi:spore coat protein X
MTSYRRYDTARPGSKKSRQFFIQGKQKSEEHCCKPAPEFDTKHCHKCHKCDKCCKCTEQSKDKSKEHSHKSPFDYYFNGNPDATVLQDGDQVSSLDQESTELIWVKESCNIEVNTTDTQAAVSLQAGLELAIALVINIAIASSEQADGVSQELLQHVNTAQRNKQKIFIYNTKDARVTTTDTDLAINIQALLQVLIALVVMIDIL